MTKARNILRDTSGASIVIALVFFLICGIIGSVVMTAASVQAKAAQTHVDLQQKEYAMQSAAKLMAQQLGGEDAVWEEKSVVVKIAYDTAGEASVDTNSLRSMIGQSFWTERRTKDILAARAEGKDYVLGSSASNRLLIDPPTTRLPRRHDGGGAGGSVHRGAGRHDARHHGDGVGNCFGPKPAGAERLVRRGGFFIRFVFLRACRVCNASGLFDRSSHQSERIPVGRLCILRGGSVA